MDRSGLSLQFMMPLDAYTGMLERVQAFQKEVEAVGVEVEVELFVTLDVKQAEAFYAWLGEEEYPGEHPALVRLRELLFEMGFEPIWSVQEEGGMVSDAKRRHGQF